MWFSSRQTFEPHPNPYAVVGPATMMMALPSTIAHQEGEMETCGVHRYGKGVKRTDYPESHYTIDEMARLIGTTRADVRARIARIEKRKYRDRSGRLRKSHIWADEAAGLLNDTGAKRLLRQGRDNLIARRVTTRPDGTLNLKQTYTLGFNEKTIFDLIQNQKIEVFLYKGRYLLNAYDVQSAATLLPPKAPDTFIPLSCLKTLRQCSKQAVYAWADRRGIAQELYRHPHHLTSVRHVSIHDAYAYLKRALGSAHRALARIKRLGKQYYRQLSFRRPSSSHHPLDFPRRHTRNRPCTPKPGRTAPSTNFYTSSGHDLIPIGP